VRDLKIKAAITEALLRGGANPKVDLPNLHLSYDSAIEVPTVSTVVRDIFERRGFLQEAASLFAVLREAEIDSQDSRESTSGKIKEESSRKRAWDHNSRETANDYYGSRACSISLVDE
jgi:hypothetical protein